MKSKVDLEKLNRYDKQKSETLERHLETVRQIEVAWKKFKEQNAVAIKLPNRFQEIRAKDEDYQFVNESANWQLIGASM